MAQKEGIEIMKKKKFPKTEKPSKNIGRWHVSVSADETKIYFWDGKSPAFNFFYKIKK